MSRDVIGIRLTVDFAFKVTFGSPEHARITIHFLNSVLKLPVPITSIKFLNPFLNKTSAADRYSVLDIHAVDASGRRFNIEMQTSLSDAMKERLVYQGARIYGSQLEEGDQYKDLVPTIVLCVLTRPLFPAVDDLHMEFRLRDVAGRVLTDQFQVHLLQLSKLTVTAQNISNASPAAQWAYFILHAHEMTIEDVRTLFPDAVFQEAAGVLEMISKTPEQLMQYDARLKSQMDEVGRIELARSEGIEIGEQRGEQRGIQIGEQRGRIASFQEMLGIDTPSAEELSRWTESQLAVLIEELRRQLRSRMS